MAPAHDIILKVKHSWGFNRVHEGMITCLFPLVKSDVCWYLHCICAYAPNVASRSGAGKTLQNGKYISKKSKYYTITIQYFDHFMEPAKRKLSICASVCFRVTDNHWGARTCGVPIEMCSSVCVYMCMCVCVCVCVWGHRLKYTWHGVGGWDAISKILFLALVCKGLPWPHAHTWFYESTLGRTHMCVAGSYCTGCGNCMCMCDTRCGSRGFINQNNIWTSEGHRAQVC
jgi:hypothetical protein